MNEPKIEWRQAGKVHAVKVDCAHDGWESYCGQKITDKFRLKHPSKVSARWGVCQTCLNRTNHKVIIVPSAESPEVKRIWHQYLSVTLRCGCRYKEQTKLRVLRDSTVEKLFRDMQTNGRMCPNHHRIEKAISVMGSGSTEQIAEPT